MNTLDSLPPDHREAVKIMARGLFADGAEHVFVAFSEKRLYVGREPATKFVDHEGVPENIKLVPADVA